MLNLGMRYHQNSTEAKGVFEDLKNARTDNFPMYEYQATQVIEYCKESLIETLANLTIEGEPGEHLFDSNRLTFEKKEFDYGDYAQGVLERFEQLLALKSSFTNKQNSFLVFAFRLALFHQFQLFFEDSKGGSIVCNGNRLKPLEPPLDFKHFAEAVLERFASFL